MKESKETIESEHPSFFIGLMNKCPAFYKKDIKSLAFIESTRKNLADYHRNNQSLDSFQELWQEFCKAEAINRLNTLGRDIANKKERDIYRKKLENFIQGKKTTQESALTM